MEGGEGIGFADKGSKICLPWDRAWAEVCSEQDGQSIRRNVNLSLVRQPEAGQPGFAVHAPGCVSSQLD